jgi:hypothetical protein
MKNWKIFLASLAALLIMVVSPLAAMAQGQTNSASTEKPRLQGALALVAPRIVRPGENMTAAVFLRKDQSPVEAVSIWSITKDREQDLKKALKPAAGKKGLNFNWEALQNLLEEKGNLLGQTGDKGKLSCTFNQTDNYLLVAVKPGFRPDYSALFVRQVLAIEAPQSAVVDETINLGVFVKGSQEAVSAAGVWAVKVENAAGLKAKMAELKQLYKENFKESKWEKVLDEKAMSLGITDEDGKISATFEKSGRYILVTVKKGFVPGFAPIVITDGAPVD